MVKPYGDLSRVSNITLNQFYSRDYTRGMRVIYVIEWN